jgi:hypothetical protein
MPETETKPTLLPTWSKVEESSMMMMMMKAIMTKKKIKKTFNMREDEDD